LDRASLALSIVLIFRVRAVDLPALLAPLASLGEKPAPASRPEKKKEEED